VKLGLNLMAPPTLPYAVPLDYPEGLSGVDGTFTVWMNASNSEAAPWRGEYGHRPDYFRAAAVRPESGDQLTLSGRGCEDRL
jgi:hypothetical protein